MTRPGGGPRARVRALLAGGVLLALLPACGVLSDTPTPLPPAPTAPAAPSTAPGPASAACDDALQSYAPDGPLPGPDDLPAGSTMARIRERGRLVAGVSADTYLLGSRNPLNGRVEGFDIDLVKAVAKAIFGDEDRYQLRVITAADRIPLLESGAVDLVARNMTITCDRWTQIAFSTEYYRSGQKVLVRRGSKATSLAQLAGTKVCAPRGTSSLTTLRAKAPEAVAVESDSHTGCLVLFQQGEVDAITGDDTVLAGLAAQDPYAVVPAQKAATAEPYGLGMNADDVDLVRFVNARLAQMRGNGEWKAIYDRWLAEPLGPAPAPPKAVYGRER
ncbi:amino acid ABC transporter substrate-binding protein, PAAT family [Friedmanniella luteola]|uniref:Amino acid ABC transporter substrate-binding protein, PAAT family n=1 Tax=Friedmanniella luteola TaxID=546871 RepID=A0A1H1VPS0_9ACTN|nr:glutamate ABC transporter substrate-binding protein [Friedmanniella luteola]SDS86934.1 amino acid ABC transporter substrate-binding protein, PAAT family [Friedmanniella luteola]